MLKLRVKDFKAFLFFLCFVSPRLICVYRRIEGKRFSDFQLVKIYSLVTEEKGAVIVR